MLVILYFTSILLTAVLSGFLAGYAWRQRGAAASRAYARLALAQCFLALAESLSMLGPTPAFALLWFRLRFLALAVTPILWLLFALEYGGWKDWLSRRLLAGLTIVPLVTQLLHWSNSLHGLWLKHDVGFHRNGPFWLADIGARIPGPGFLVHAFYALLLLLAGIVLLLITAWRMRHLFRRQALLVASAGLVAFVFASISIFNLLPAAAFNLFTPGIGLSVPLIALGVFRFQLLKVAPAGEATASIDALAAQTRRSLAVFLLIFIVMAAGIAAGGYLSYQGHERQFRDQVESQLSGIATLKVNELQNWRNERIGDGELVRQNTAFAALVQRSLADSGDAQAQEQLQVWLDSLRRAYRYDRVFLLDVGGIERVSSPATPERAAAHLARDVAVVLSTGQVAFLDFHRDAADAPIYLSLLVPIYAEQDNRPLGALVLRMDPNAYLYPFIQQWPVSTASAETLLVRREGDDVLFLNELQFQPASAFKLRFPLTQTTLPAVQAVLGREGIVEGLDYRGTPVIAAVRGVPDSPWFLVAKMDTAEMYVPLRERLWETVAFLAALLAAAGAGLLLVWRQQRLRYYRGRVQAAQALRESLERFELANQATFDAIWDWNLQTDALWWNENFQTLFGYRAEEIEPGIESWTRRIHPEDLARVETGIHAAIDSGQQSWADHYRFRRKDGQYADIEDRGSISRDASGKPIRMIGAMQDITERKRAEEALRQRSEELATVLDALPVFAWTSLDPECRVIVGNRAANELAGIMPGINVSQTAAAAGQAVYIRQLKPDGSEYQPEELPMQRAAALGQPVRDVEVEICLADGRRVHVLGNAAPLFTAQGQVRGGVSAFVDITGRKQAEARLAHLNEVLRAVRDVNQLITRERDPQRLMSKACAILVQTRGYRMAWIGLIEAGHPRVVPMACAGQGTAYLDGVTITWDESETGQGPSGIALRTRQPATCADIATDARFAPWREAALEHGFASVAVVPMRYGERLFGVVSVYADKPNAFDDEEISLLAELAGDLGFALQSIEDEAERKRAEEQTRQLLAESEQSRRSLLSVLEDQKRTEAALAQERNLLRTLIDNLPDYVWVKDVESRFVVGNSAVARSFGKTRPEEIYGMTDFDYHAPELAAQFYADEQAVLRSGQPLINREEVVTEPAGNQKWLMSTKVPLRGGHGEVVGLVGIGRDITEQVRAREALQQYAARLETMHEIDQVTLAAQPIATIAETTLRGLRRLVPYWLASVVLFDVEAGEATVVAVHAEGETWLWPGARFPSQAFRMAELQQGRPHVVEDMHNLSQLSPELQALQAEGMRSFVNIPLFVEGRPIGMLNLGANRVGAFPADQVAIARQVADQLAVAIQQAHLREQVACHTAELEQRVAERTAELRTQFAQLEAILNSVSDGVAVTTAEGQIIQLNPVAQRWLGETLTGRDADRLRQAIGALAPQAAQRPTLDLQLEKLDLQLGVAPIARTGSAEQASVVTLHDVSELKALDRMRAAFVSNVSHELRTPATTIKLAVALLRRKPKENWEKYLVMLETESERLAKLVEDILEISRIESGRVELHEEQLDLAEFSHAVAEGRRPLAEDRGLTLTAEAPTPGPIVRADPDRLREIANNLLENAIWYTLSGGQIVVSAGQDVLEGREWACFRVSDTGMGIPPEELPLIFERFYRGAQPQAMQIAGTGLGLAIVKELVELHDGRITVQSQVGVGTTFTVWLPLA